MADTKRVLLVVSGGIAAYKTLEVVRGLRQRSVAVRAILTRGGAEFVTPLSLAAVTEDKVYQNIFSLTDESEMGHIRLSREADVILVAPATADILAKMAAGICDDLATTALLATDKPVIVAPAMNVRMWEHAATQANLRTLEARRIRRIGPNEGDMACGEWGMGRMAEPAEIVAAVLEFLGAAGVPAAAATLQGRRALVTSGPTQEAIDPVRYITNRSSGKQGHAIAGALARLGAETVLVTGPTGEPDPPGVQVVRVESARDMLAACERSLPVDIAVCAAAVADWRVADPSPKKIKKTAQDSPALKLERNPDILAQLSQTNRRRPRLVVGFAAETENVVENAMKKLTAKGCDWVVANDVSEGTGTFGGESNTVHLVSSGNGKAEVEHWPQLTKRDVAERLAERISAALGGRQ
ncbi:MAG: bifunctional phosphopantothenoylcysteine decarboxylase/phosphopantothenate--cysteine ligase CoaBC [Rhodospirillales bacterium]|nr:bifunctional phosphopantothenoylcysteine decarboxylase/phosphopantothenate--cysteine ligase CoaBC [Rhodospirillales bacterium]